jgi:hypothetical protein
MIPTFQCVTYSLLAEFLDSFYYDELCTFDLFILSPPTNGYPSHDMHYDDE